MEMNAAMPSLKPVPQPKDWMGWMPLALPTGDGLDVVVSDLLTAGLDGHAAHRGLNVLSTVAHELRGPLMALATSSELLAEDFDVLDQRQVREMVAAIHCRALWLQGLVENLLCAATIREGRFQIQPQPINLIEVVMEVQQVVEPLLVQKEQRLRLWARPQVAAVLADSRRLGQVLVNLVLNASKFSDRGTAIDIMLSSRREYVRVTVADRGPGLPEGSAEQLFQPFYRAASASQSGAEGVGLGLAIVKSIVEAHGGRVGAGNRRGGGARFWFELSALPASCLPHADWRAPEGRRR